jgi:ABC-type branched-subunit amino acid transport system substrate-binding protein
MEARSISRRMAAHSLAALALVMACAPEPKTNAGAIKIGLLLPYTGPSSATSTNFERAVLFARDKINEGDGIKGRPVEVVEADTHSDAAHARRSVDALIAAGVVVVIGPESAEIAAEIKPILDANQIVFLSPLVGAADDAAVDCTTPWFRLAPSARALGEALAKQAWADQITTAACFHAEGTYDQALGDAFSKRFAALGGRVTVDATLHSDAQSYADSISANELAFADAQVLSATPRAAALLVNELRFLDQNTRWYLSPLLKTQLLLENVGPQALEGATGVTPKISDTSADFPTAFAARWSGDRPLDGAYFYYDAMALLAFGLERAQLVDGQLTASALRAAIGASTGNRGESGAWDDIGVSLQRLREGVDMNYSGLTGPILLQDCGDRRSGESSRWSVQGGQIVSH